MTVSRNYNATSSGDITDETILQIPDVLRKQMENFLQELLKGEYGSFSVHLTLHTEPDTDW